MKNRLLFLLLILLTAGCSSEGGIGGTGGTALPPIGSSTTTVSGQANKGPFDNDAGVQIIEISSNGESGAVLGNGRTQGLGEYQIDINEAELVLVQVSGTYLSENLGASSSAAVNLRGIGNPEETLHINVATHLIEDRVRRLMNEGNDFTAAANMATAELFLSMAPVLPSPASAVRFTDVVLINAADEAANPEGNAWLLTLSSLLDGAAVSDTSPEVAVQQLLNELAAELADDGLIGTARLTPLIEARASVNPDQIHTALLNVARDLVSSELTNFGVREDAAATLDCTASTDEVVCDDPEGTMDAETSVAIPLANIVADMNLFLDSDGDGEVNATDPDDDNDGIEDAEDDSPYSVNN